jgi:hypothetical protein
MAVGEIPENKSTKIFDRSDRSTMPYSGRTGPTDRKFLSGQAFFLVQNRADINFRRLSGERADWENTVKKKRLNEHVGIQR